MDKIVENNITEQIEKLETCMNASETTMAWERGRSDAVRQLLDNCYPDDTRILESAEMAYKIISEKYGDIFSSIYAGFNANYDEPTMIFVLNKENEGQRVEISHFATELEFSFCDHGMLSLSIMVSRESSTDMSIVKKDMIYQRAI